MDFESPDVEREFPGLYASESGSGKRSLESDFSDDAHERTTKKELLIGKRKDKKESKKDQGYAALEGESSPEEDVDVKSPCKSKKSKSFKFPTIKDKREKSREKDGKEKEKDKDKDKEKDKDKDVDRDKEKKKELKSKLKLKDKKKVKPSDDAVESCEEMPVFGVPLSVAVDRSHCHDGIAIPVVVRDCIDHVQDCGLTTENIYKIVGIKSKVQHLRRSYNKREIVKLSDYDMPAVTSLLKTFLRELPEPILTSELTPKFEDAASLKELPAREQELSCLLSQIPSCNLLCLSWVVRHLENVASNECQNKMSISALGAIFGPLFQTSSRLACSLMAHCNALFPNIKIVRYIPPLSSGCTSLPSTKEAITTELVKQDSLLNQIHSEMNHGYTVRSDQLWEVQRFITLLKRKLRTLEKSQETSSQAADKLAIKAESSVASVPNNLTKVAPISPSADKIDFQLQVATDAVTGSDANEKESIGEVDENPPPKDAEDPGDCKEPAIPSVSTSAEPAVQEPVTKVLGPCASVPAPSSTAHASASDQPNHTSSSSESEEKSYELHLGVELELIKLQNSLISRISAEHDKIEDLRADLKTLTGILPDSTIHNTLPINSDAGVPLEDTDTSIVDPDGEWGGWEKEKMELYEQIEKLTMERFNLVRGIMCERESCIGLKIQLEQFKHLAET